MKTVKLFNLFLFKTSENIQVREWWVIRFFQSFPPHDDRNQPILILRSSHTDTQSVRHHLFETLFKSAGSERLTQGVSRLAGVFQQVLKYPSAPVETHCRGVEGDDKARQPTDVRRNWRLSFHVESVCFHWLHQHVHGWSQWKQTVNNKTQRETCDKQLLMFASKETNLPEKVQPANTASVKATDTSFLKRCCDCSCFCEHDESLFMSNPPRVCARCFLRCGWKAQEEFPATSETAQMSNSDLKIQVQIN